MAEDKDKNGKDKKPGGLFAELQGLGEALVKKAKETPVVGDVVKKVEGSEVAKGALKGAAAGTFIPGIGTLYGAAIGAASKTETGKQIIEAGKQKLNDMMSEFKDGSTEETEENEPPKKQDPKGPKGPGPA